MIINNHQSPFNYQLDEVNSTNTFTSPRTPSTTLSEFNSNIKKYRNFKQGIHRINNIDNEINFINNNIHCTSVNFFKTLRISKEDYDESIAVSNDIIERLTDDEIADVI